MGAATDVEAAGKNAFGCDAVSDAALHDVPYFQNALAYLRLACGVLWKTGAFIGEHDLGNGQRMRVRLFEKLGGAVEWVGKVDGIGGWSGCFCAVFGDESAADGEECPAHEHRAALVEGS
jgi:hypothetical protein